MSATTGDRSLPACGCDCAQCWHCGAEGSWKTEPSATHAESWECLRCGAEPGQPCVVWCRIRTTGKVEVKAADDIARWSDAASRESLTLSAWLRAAAELAIARGSTR